MPDRRSQIIHLLGSRFDYVFEPETFTGKVVRRAATTARAGGSPSHWKTCEPCKGSGSVTRFRKLEPCDVCQGVGKVRVDDYTGAVVVTDEERVVKLGELIRRDTVHVKCPDCQDLRGHATGVIRGKPCRRCNGTGQAPVAGSWIRSIDMGERDGTGDALDAMLDQIARREKLGSYRELDHALAALARARPYIVKQLDKAYLLHDLDLDALPAHGHRLLDIGISFLDARMPTPIVVPRDVTRAEEARAEQLRRIKGRGTSRQALERRDKEIRWLVYGEERAVQWVAREFGLSPSQVNRIAPPRRELSA